MKALTSLFLHWAQRLQRERRQYFDEDIDPDEWDLLQTASLLEIKEFDVFQLAYRDWYGRLPKPRVAEAYFADYMFARKIPIWVRRFTRKVIDLHARNELDPRKLGVYKPLPSKRLKQIGKVYIVLLSVVLLYLTLLAYRDTAFVQSLLPEKRYDLKYQRQNITTP